MKTEKNLVPQTLGSDEQVSKPAHSHFVLFNTPLETVREAVAANLGDPTMSANALLRIKLPSGGSLNWTVTGPEGEETRKDLIGILLGSAYTRSYWPSSLDHSEGSAPPDCYSLDAKTGTGNPGGDCLSCRFARFGSNGEAPACKRAMELFFLLEGDALPHIVRLSPMSIKPAEDYLQRLTTKALPCYAVRTRIGLEKATNNKNIVYAKANLTIAELLEPDKAVFMRQYVAALKPLMQAMPMAPAETETEKREGEVV